MTIYSWNVNGIRAAARTGFLPWLDKARPDILCVQETKAHEGDLDETIRAPKGYGTVWHSAKRRGYSGTATFFRKTHAPLEVRTMGIEEFDTEGRVQILEYGEFHLINAYFPNSQPERKRLAYKLAFNNAIRKLCNRIRRSGNHVVVCGDFNVAHKPIDLARPKENRNNPGFYPEECASMNTFVRAGYVDTFRRFHPKEPGHYSWWSYRTNARERNVGWRLDYHCVNREFLDRVSHTEILSKVFGSDHCPVAITLR